MPSHTKPLSLAVVVAVLGLSVIQWSISAQDSGAEKSQVADKDQHFEFVVVESYDAMYLGDTPGHRGRSGNMKSPPDLALGDPVYRGNVVVGKISHLIWDRTKENLEIEFDPEPYETGENGRVRGPLRIAISDKIWVPLGGNAPKPAR